MEASLWLYIGSQNESVAKGWLSTLCWWEAAIHTNDYSWKNVNMVIMIYLDFAA